MKIEICFCYDEETKKLTTTDFHQVVVWENVEKELAIEASEMYRKSENFDNLLQQNGCTRFRGNKS